MDWPPAPGCSSFSLAWRTPTCSPRSFARLRPIDPDKIVVFGSRSHGDARADSDLDLMVVERGGGSLGERGLRVGGALGDVGIPVDLVVYTPAEYDKLRRWRSSIAAIADREGRVLYEARRAA